MGKIQQIVQRFHRQILALEAQSTAALNHHYRAMLPKIKADIDLLTLRMEHDMSAGKLSPSWLYEQHRLARLQQTISSQIDGFAHTTQTQVTRGTMTAAHLGSTYAHAMLQASLPKALHHTFGQPSLQAIQSQIGALQPGSPLHTLFNGWGKDAADRAGKTLVYGVTSGRNPRAVARDLQQDLGIIRNRALVISRNEMLRSYRSASLESYRSNSDVISGWRWLASLSDRSCIACIEKDGTVHSLDEELNSHVCCFVAGTVVTGPQVVGSTTRWYDGEVIDIDTISGNHATVTPNHPILTPHGWVAAGKLQEGGHVISRLFLERPLPTINPNDYQVEALIEQVAMTFGGVLPMKNVTMPTASKDFHGDGIGSQIHIVRSNGQLGDDRDATLFEPNVKQLFVGGGVCQCALPRLGTFAQFLKWPRRPSHRVVCRSRSLLSFLSRHACHHQVVGFTGSATLDASVPQSRRNAGSRNTERFSDGFFRLASEVTLYNFLARQGRTFKLPLRASLTSCLPPFRRGAIKSKLCPFSKVTNSDAILSKPAPQDRRTNVILSGEPTQGFTSTVARDSSIEPFGQRLGDAFTPLTQDYTIVSQDPLDVVETDMANDADLIKRLSGHVQSDEILSIRKRSFNGHVYNLQTVEGWYSGNNIISHNCRCSAAPITRSYSEILGDAGIDGSDISEEDPTSWQTGHDWFEGQGETMQRSILGPATYNAYQEGDVELADLVGHADSAVWGPSIYVKSLKQLGLDAADYSD